MNNRNQPLTLKRQQELMNTLSNLQDEVGIENLLDVLAIVQKENCDYYACKFGQTENITKFYEKTNGYFDTMATRVNKLKKRYPTLREV